jgi:hypothetical protein
MHTSIVDFFSFVQYRSYHTSDKGIKQLELEDMTVGIVGVVNCRAIFTYLHLGFSL